jgi:hypothetical protein
MNDEEYISRLKKMRAKIDYCIGLICAKEYQMHHRKLIETYTDLHYYLIDSRKQYFPEVKK